MFYRLTLKEWLRALKQFDYGSPADKTHGLLATLNASFDNYMMARAQVKKPPRSFLDHLPWIKRAPQPRLEDRLRGRLREIARSNDKPHPGDPHRQRDGVQAGP